MAKSYLDKDGLLYFLQKIRPSATPSMDGSASTGTSKRFAAEDHVHPTDTSRAPLASPALTGTPTAPTATTGTATTQIATTEFVSNTVGAMTSGVADVIMNGNSIVSSGIATIPEATTSANGYMTSAQATKLSGIATGAEVNQNAFSTVKVGTTSLSADSKTDTLTITAGSNITLTPTASSDSFTIAATDTTYSDATTSTHGLMSTSDKSKLDSLTITNGVIDASNLPSYVDDVIEAYPRSGATALSSTWLSTTSGGSALTPETGKIYVLMADSGDYTANSQFRWSGSAYVKLADGGVSSITNSEIDTIVAS